tara:strand:- start:32743 stop:34053 length:1311 start_codon:yes stop_codon:yes gene_type:complete
MARIASLDDVGPKLRSQLLSQLRVTDEAVVLPQAHVSVESKTAKNVVMRICGSEPGLQPEVFSANWFGGVSLVQVPNHKAEVLLSDRRARREALAKLKDAVPSEMADSQLQVGPELSCDEQDRDCADWVAGFDGPSCCVGLYSALQSRSPDSTDSGMSRVHRSYYLACKAGAGMAAQTFHARLASALKGGATLDEALSEEGSPGAKALRRVALAAKRNRARILVAAAEALGFFGIDTIGDNASPAGRPYRIAVPTIDCSFNSIGRAEGGSASRSVWQYASGCVDAGVSTGVLSSSNVAEGFVAFTTQSGEPRIHLKNDAYSCIPFSTIRIMADRDAVLKATDAHKRAKQSMRAPHPDHDWVSERFAWKSKIFADGQPDIEPPCIWGTHCSESYLSEWARELGVSRASAIRLQPELVVLSSVEQGKLRVASKAVMQA